MDTMARFGGHTSLFNAVVCAWPDNGMVRTLLDRGAAKDARADLRRFLDWTEQPRWHEAHDVTATAEWDPRIPR